MKKRITAILLTFAMVVTAVPTTAFVSAEELEVVETITPDEAVVEEAAPAEVVAEPETPAEDAVIVEDAVVVEPEAPAAVAEDALDIVEEVVEDGAAEEVAADDANDGKVEMKDLVFVVHWSDGTTREWKGEDIMPAWTYGNGYGVNTGNAVDEVYSKESGSGEGICPEVEVLWKGKPLDPTAYTVSYKNNTAPGWHDEVNPPTIWIDWTSGRTDVADLKSLAVLFNIGLVPADPKNITVSIEGEKVPLEKMPLTYSSYIYDGKPHRPEITVFDGTRELVYGEDYTLSYARSDVPNSWPPVNDKDMIKPGTYRMFVNLQGAYRNAQSAVNGGNAVVQWTIEKADFNNDNISTPTITLFTDNFGGAVSVNEAYNEIRRRVYNKLENEPWELRGTMNEYGVYLYDVDQNTGKVKDYNTYETTGNLESSFGKGYKYVYNIKLNETASKYFKRATQSAILEGELWIVKGTAKLSAIVENRSEAIQKALETAAVYSGANLKTDIETAIKGAFNDYTGAAGNIEVEGPKEVKEVSGNPYTFVIKGVKGSAWEGQTYNYLVNVGRKQMADSRSAGRYVTFADDFTGTAKQYSRVDGSAGKVVVNITDNGTPLTEVKDYTVASVPDVWNEYVYITGQGNYKTTRGDDPVQIKVAVKRTGTVNLAGDDIVCRIEDQPFLGAEHKFKVTSKGQITVAEVIDGQEVPIPEDWWDIKTTDCTDGEHWIAGEHSVTIVGKKGAEGEATAKFNIRNDDINDDYKALLEKTTFKLTDTQVAWKDLGIKVYKTTETTMIIDWRKFFDLKLTCTKKGDGTQVIYDTRDKTSPSSKFITANGITFEHAGTYKVELHPRKDSLAVAGYIGSVLVPEPESFTVEPRDFTEWSESNYNNRIKVSDKETTMEWPGRAVIPSDFERLGIKVLDAKRGDIGLTKDVDYTVEYVSGGTKAGEPALFTLKGKGNYDDTQTIDITVKVTKFNLSKVQDSWLKIDDQPYWGGAAAEVPEEDIKKELKVYLGDPTKATTPIMPVDDYSVTCKDVTAAGKWAVGDRVQVTVTSTDTENYMGSFAKTTIFNITPANIGDTKLFEVGGVPDVKAGTGEAEKPADNATVTDTRNRYQLTANEYAAAFKANVGDGEGTVVITAVGPNYTGTRSVTVKRNLDDGSIEAEDVTYNGKAQEPKLTVKDALGNIVSPDDYTPAYSNNTNAGTASVTVTVKDTSKGYTGTLKGTFEIKKAANSLTVSPTTVYVAPEEKLPIAVTSDAPVDERVFESADKTVAIVDKDGNVTGVKAGATTTVKVTTGGKNYEAKEATVTVVVKQPTVITAVDKRVVWTGAAQSIDLGARASSGAALTYTVTDASNAKGGISVVNGKASVTADFMGEAKVTISAPNTDGYQAATKTISVKVSPEDIKVLKATSKNGKIVVKYSTTASATKYQLQIADNASFKNARTIKSKMWGDPNKRTVKTKIKKGKTYYVRVRACSKAGKVLFHSVNWSKAVAVKVR